MKIPKGSAQRLNTRRTQSRESVSQQSGARAEKPQDVDTQSGCQTFL